MSLLNADCEELFVVIARFDTTQHGIINVAGPFLTVEGAEAHILERRAAKPSYIYSVWPVLEPVEVHSEEEKD